MKKSEQNIMNICKQWDDIQKILFALNVFSYKMLNETIGKKDFDAGLVLLRKAVNAEQAEAISKCFLLSGLGGKEAAKYSRDKFKEAFGEGEVLKFLKENGTAPSSWATSDDGKFKEKAKQTIEKLGL